MNRFVQPVATVLAAACLMMISGATPPVRAAEPLSKKTELIKRDARRAVPTPLGRNVRLTFIFRNADGVPAMSIFTATTDYAIVMEFDNQQVNIASDMAGELHPIDGKPNHLLLTYGCSIAADGPEFNVNLYASGSAVVELGTEAKLMDVAGKTLVVQVEEVK